MIKIFSILILSNLYIISCIQKKQIEVKEVLNLNSANENGVFTVISTQNAFPVQLNANATIKAQNQSQLFFKAMGEIEQINVSNNSVVKAGQILAVLDNRQAEVAIQIAKDQIAKAKYAINKMILEYGGKDGDTTSVKPRFLENMKLQSGYYEAYTALYTAQLQYDNTYLRAPYTGIVANLKTKAHNQASSSEPFCTVISSNILAAEAFILESELEAVQIGQSTKIQPLAYADKTYLGRVFEINPQVNLQGLVAIKIRINNPDKYLLDGMNAKIVIEKLIANQIVIPKTAVVERSGRKVVFTYEKGLAKWHYVTIAHENETEVAISEGLKAGEMVITKGNLNLGHDAAVSLKQE
jgi:RND family efflux transporter MFP subunit